MRVTPTAMECTRAEQQELGLWSACLSRLLIGPGMSSRRWPALSVRITEICRSSKSTMVSKMSARDHKRAAELACEVNQQRPTVDTLLFEARAKRDQNNLDSAIELLKRAEQILVGTTDYRVSAKTESDSK